MGAVLSEFGVPCRRGSQTNLPGHNGRHTTGPQTASHIVWDLAQKEAITRGERSPRCYTGALKSKTRAKRVSHTPLGGRCVRMKRARAARRKHNKETQLDPARGQCKQRSNCHPTAAHPPPTTRPTLLWSRRCLRSRPRIINAPISGSRAAVYATRAIAIEKTRASTHAAGKMQAARPNQQTLCTVACSTTLCLGQPNIEGLNRRTVACNQRHSM